MRWVADGDPSIKDLCAPEFRDNVRSGLGMNVFDIVGGWFAASFSDRSIEHHTTMTDGERLIIWFTFTESMSATDSREWSTSRWTARLSCGPRCTFSVWRTESVHQHWAVRDDLAMLDSTQRPPAD